MKVRRSAPPSSGQAQADGPLPGPAVRLEEGDRDAGARPQDRLLRGGLSAMAIRTVKPTSPGRRFQTYVTYDEITKTEPEKGAARPKRRTNGRNNYGRITVRHRGRRRTSAATACRLPARQGRRPGPGGGDRVRSEPLGAHRAAALPRRREALHPRARTASKVGDTRRCRGRRPTSSPATPAAPQHPARHDRPQRRAAARARRRSSCRSAGTRRQLMAKEGDYALRCKLPSGELRAGRVSPAWRPIGQVGNLDHENISFGKAGRVRWLGCRPTCAAPR